MDDNDDDSDEDPAPAKTAAVAKPPKVAEQAIRESETSNLRASENIRAS